MKLLGITGGIGAGKSAVSQCFADLGAEIVDADVIARQVLETNGSAYPETVAVFGEEIVNADGQIDRKKIAGIVFSDPEKLQRLNAITHTCVFREMEQRIKASVADLVCLDVPLLFSCDFPLRCDKTLAVLAPTEIRIQRVMKRDGCTREQVEERMACQLTDEVLRQKADFCIVNDGDTAELRKDVQEIYFKIMESSV
ncbi:MAG: dephospho-CoA kinase [Clostridia bacterium]|nr:dephospho-CoA kinase [Clostridia bacterium]